MRYAALILLLIAAPALADERIARQGEDEVRVFDGPCVSAETAGRIPPQLRDEFHKAVGRFQGSTFFGCWRQLGPDNIGILWEDGDQGIIPLSDLKPVVNI